MKVLVTGAGGFVGRYVVAELLKRGHKVTVTGRTVPSALEKDLERVTYIAHDICVPSKGLFTKLGSPEVLIHLAWGGLPDFKNKAHTERELPAHQDFLTTIVKEGLRSLTVTGTCLEYGMQEGELSEEMAVFPSTPYARAKDQLRRHLEGLQKETGLDLKWVRLFYMYGKGQSPKSLLAQLDAALDSGQEVFNMSAGEQWRDYLPVEKVAENVVIFALQQKIQGIINCCSNTPISIRQLVTEHLQKRGKSITLNLGHYPYPDYEPFRFWGSNKKQESILKHESDRTI